MTTGLSFKLIETDLELIQGWMQAQMPAALSRISLDRDSVIGQLPIPREYLTYEKAMAYQAPCIFIVPVSQDFRLYEKNSNSINALSHINVTAVIESNKDQNLSYVAYRYQAAMCQVLTQQCLLNTDQSVQIIIKVVRARFSPTYTESQKPGVFEGVFRKEVLLELDVEHYEKL